MKIRETYLYLSWLLAAISVAASIFFSNYMDLPPCNLCWYQRIFMFPLVFVLGVGFLLQDKRVSFYSLPLIASGWLISIYHNLLYYKWITPEITPCSGGVSCTERQLNLFGFLSIPLMSLISFTALLIFMTLYFRKGRAHEAH